jgi:predicted nucleotide-binding protein (sugar kinase/HSP70/actin superfamily)
MLKNYRETIKQFFQKEILEAIHKSNKQETIDEKKAIIELSKEALKIDIGLDFTQSFAKMKRDGDLRFFNGNTEDEIKQKLAQFNQVYRNNMFVEYCEYLINLYATKSIYEAETETQMLASRMTIYGINEVLSSMKRASELYEQQVFKTNQLEDLDGYMSG